MATGLEPHACGTYPGCSIALADTPRTRHQVLGTRCFEFITEAAMARTAFVR